MRRGKAVMRREWKRRESVNEVMMRTLLAYFRGCRRKTERQKRRRCEGDEWRGEEEKGGRGKGKGFHRSISAIAKRLLAQRVW